MRFKDKIMNIPNFITDELMNIYPEKMRPLVKISVISMIIVCAFIFISYIITLF